MSSLLRSAFAVEGVILSLLAIASLTLFTQGLPNLIAGAAFGAYFVIMFAASLSLLLLAIDGFQARTFRISGRWHNLFLIGLAGAAVATVAFGLAAYFAKPDEGNLAIAAVHYIYAPYLFLWVPLGHVWIECRRSQTTLTCFGRSRF
jgi:hypothetical protein